jgi:hypothetical protein
MSDVWASVGYATVWDAAEGKFLVRVVSNSEFSGHYNSTIVTIDATPEVLELWAVAERGKAYAERLRAEEQAYWADFQRKATIAIGKRVRVVRGRKIPVGTEGTVFWLRDGRIGARTSDRRDARGQWTDVAWVDARNCAVVNERTGLAYEY